MAQDLSTFNRALPFGKSNPIDLKVNSDHAAIKCCIIYSDTELKIGAVNISNKEYHKYFQKGPFAHTHMPASTSSTDWLVSKTAQQLDQIIQEISSDLDVQIIVEGYHEFFTNLGTKTSVKLVSVLDKPAHGYESSAKNITGILLNESKVKLIESDVIQISYKDGSKDSKLIVPWAKISRQGHELVVAGVHLPGCESQYPSEALEELGKIIGQLEQKFHVDIIAMGDFNTVPANIMKSLPGIKLIQPKYLTHINPNNDVAVYDNAICHLVSSDISVELLGLDSIPADSKALVQSLNASYVLAQK